jgi:hypothetical protein
VVRKWYGARAGKLAFARDQISCDMEGTCGAQIRTLREAIAVEIDVKERRSTPLEHGSNRGESVVQMQSQDVRVPLSPAGEVVGVGGNASFIVMQATTPGVEHFGGLVQRLSLHVLLCNSARLFKTTLLSE